MTGRDRSSTSSRRARRRRATAATSCSRSRAWRWRACSAASTSRCAPARSSGSPAWSGAGRSEILETVYGARRADRGHRHRRRHAAAARVGRRAPSRPASGWPRRSARARACCSTRPSTATSPSPRWAGSPAPASSTARPSATRPRELTESLDVRPPGVDRAGRAPCPAATSRRSCSARWLLRDCRVLLLDEPTRGVDVGARSEIYALVRALADAGVAVVVVSSEVEEVLGLADRVLVVREGRRRPRGARRPRSTSTGSSTWSWKEASHERRPDPTSSPRPGGDDRHARAGGARPPSGRLGRAVGCCTPASAATSAWSSRWSCSASSASPPPATGSPTSTTC